MKFIYFECNNSFQIQQNMTEDGKNKIQKLMCYRYPIFTNTITHNHMQTFNLFSHSDRVEKHKCNSILKIIQKYVSMKIMFH
jgi:hypothetical protein